MSRLKTLVWLLRLLGASALLALGAVVMPMSWMAAIHRALGLGEMPSGPIVEYLARSLSAFYAFFGALCLMLANDVDRNRWLVRILGGLLALFGAVMLGIDLSAGMPSAWTAGEGPVTIAMGLFILWLS